MVVIRAGRLREWSQGELWLYYTYVGHFFLNLLMDLKDTFQNNLLPLSMPLQINFHSPQVNHKMVRLQCNITINDKLVIHEALLAITLNVPTSSSPTTYSSFYKMTLIKDQPICECNGKLRNETHLAHIQYCQYCGQFTLAQKTKR